MAGKKLSTEERRAKAIELAQRKGGVTAVEFAKAVGQAKNVGPMSAILSRLVKAKVLTMSDKTGTKVFNFDSSAASDKPKKTTKKSTRGARGARGAKGGRKKSTRGKKASSSAAAKKSSAKSASKGASKAGRKPGRPKGASKAGRKPGRKPGRPKGSGKKAKASASPLEDLLRLSGGSKGVTVNELATARDSKTVGPLQRTINTALKQGLVSESGKRGGKPVYKATGKAPAAAAPKKRGKPGRPKGSGKKKAASTAAAPKKRGPGRPKGSGKKKAASTVAKAAAASGNNEAIAQMLEAVIKMLRS